MTPALATKRPRPQVAQAAHIPAPLGGIDQLSPGSAMDPANCVALYNHVAGKLGLRVRLGWREWCTGLGDLPVKSILPFTGSAASGANNRLFACTAHGIWDVSASSSTPTEVMTFANSTDDAGWGTCHVMVTGAGHFLLYADEENGLYVYTENGDTWTKLVPAATVAWAATTTYTAGTYVLNDSGKTYLCSVGGVSAGSGGPTGTATTPIVDDGATWLYVSQVVSGVDPANLCFVTVWKNRVWCVEKNTAKAWYFPIGAVFAPSGAGAASFNFGNQFRAGGGLRGLWNFTPNGAISAENYLVAISDAGDLLSYGGTDATTMGMVGAWFVGAIPAGRRIATDFGGDMLILSALGAIPLSTVMGGGGGAANAGQYATAKVATLFNAMSQAYRGNKGWALRLHPEDNALMCLIPVSSTTATQQLVMSTATKGWSQYSDLPIFSAETWGGKLYFGTADGRVCINDGYVDGTLLDGTAGSAIQYAGLTAFQNLGTPRQKQVQLIRPVTLAGSNAPNCSAQARYDYDESEIATVTAQDGTGEVWDVGQWDVAQWGPDSVTSQPTYGATGMGTTVGVAWHGAANTKTVLAGIDLMFTVGGFL